MDGLDEILNLTDAEFENLEEYNKRAAIDQNLPTNTKELVWAILNKVILPKASVVATSRPHTSRIVADKLSRIVQEMTLVPLDAEDNLKMLKFMLSDENQDPHGLCDFETRRQLISR